VRERARAEPHVKGVAFRSTLNALRGVRGSDAVAATLDQLEAPFAESLRLGGLSASAWYPLASYRALLAAARRATRSGPELLRALGREASLTDFRGVYRVVAFVLSPQRLIAQAPRAWALYFDSGAIEIVEAREGMARARYTNCAGFDRNVWERAIGGSLGLLEVCGAQHVRLRVVSGGGDGDDSLDLEARWIR
jgi:hypothetical protein